MVTTSNPDKINSNSQLGKLLIPIQSVKDIRYGMELYITSDGSTYYKEVMRKQYKFEKSGEYKGYLDYVAVKVRDKKCFIVSNL